jgi:hypothetical protein
MILPPAVSASAIVVGLSFPAVDKDPALAQPATRRLTLAGDGPDEASHLARDRRRHNDLRLAERY